MLSVQTFFWLWALNYNVYFTQNQLENNVYHENFNGISDELKLKNKNLAGRTSAQYLSLLVGCKIYFLQCPQKPFILFRNYL